MDPEHDPGAMSPAAGRTRSCDAMLALDRGGVIRFASPNVDEVVGYFASELVGRSIGLFALSARHGPTSGHCWLRWLRRATRDGRRVELRIRGRDGEAVPVILSATNLDENGLLLLSLEDIRCPDTEIGRNSELAQIVGTALEAIVTIDGDHRIRRFNRAAEELFGWSAVEILGQPLDRLLPRWACEAHHGHVEAFGQGAPGARLMRDRGHVAARHRDGHEIPVEASIIKYERRGHTLFTAILRDVRERRAREAELRRSRARLANAQRIARLGNWEWDIDTDLLHWSDEIYRILGYDPGSFQPTYSAFLDIVHPDDRVPVDEAVRQALADGTPYEIDHRVLRPDGRDCIVHEQAEVMRDEAGRPRRMVGTAQDVTELRQREQALVKAKQQAESASRAKSEFLAAMSHELRTPLNAVIGFADVIRQDLLGGLGNPRYRDYARDIADSGAHLLNVLNDILDVSRVEAGRIEIHEEPLSLPDLVAACRRLMADRAEQAGVALAERLPDELPELRGDARLIKQMLINLLSNAIKFTPPGGAVEIRAQRAPDTGIALAVRDTGPGIAAGDRERVLQPFEQAGGADVYRKSHGVGLGLALVKAFAEAHGGRVELDSTPGEGTEVRIMLPAWRAARQGELLPLRRDPGAADDAAPADARNVERAGGTDAGYSPTGRAARTQRG